MQFLPVSTLTHSGSISWLQVQTLLLFSHADCNYFTHKLLHSCPPPYPATVSFSFFLCHVFCFGGGCPFLLLVTLITPLQRATWPSLQLLPHGSLIYDGKDTSALPGVSDRRRRRKMWRHVEGDELLHQEITTVRYPYERHVKPVAQNCAQVVQEMNLQKST